MRSVVVLILLLVVLTTVAVRGSRAQPVPQTSVAFSHCERHGNMTLESRCRPGGGIVPDAEEAGFDRDYVVDAHGFGGDFADGERKWMEVVLVVTELVHLVLSNWDKLFGSLPAVASTPQISDALFDPVK